MILCGMLQATELMLEQFPQLVVEYCQTFYKLDLVWWRQLLDDLMQRITSTQDTAQAALRSVYKGQ